jgi:hypothetical protein
VREWYSQIGKMGGATTNPAKLAAIAKKRRPRKKS